MDPSVFIAMDYSPSEKNWRLLSEFTDRFAASSLGHFDHQDRTVSVQDYRLADAAEQQLADRVARAKPDDDELSTAALRSSDDSVIRVEYGGRLEVELKASVDNMLTGGLDLGRERSLVD
jgi:hypothetical protein